MFGSLSLKSWTQKIRTPQKSTPKLRRSLDKLEERIVPATYTWTQTAPGSFDWNNPANWGGGSSYPANPGDVANLTAALAGDETINLNVAVTIGTLTLGSTSSSGAFIIAASGGSLTFQDPSGTADLTETNDGGDTINATVILASNLDAVNNSPAVLTVAGNVANGSNAITFSGTGNQTYTGVFTGTAVGFLPGPVTKDGSGTVILGDGSSGQLTVNAGTLLYNNTSGWGPVPAERMSHPVLPWRPPGPWLPPQPMSSPPPISTTPSTSSTKSRVPW